MENFKYMKTFESLNYTENVEKIDESIKERIEKFKDVEDVGKAFNKIFGKTPKHTAQKQWEKYYNMFGKLNKQLSDEEKQDMKTLISDAEKAVTKGVKKIGLALSNDNNIKLKLTFDREAGGDLSITP